MSSIKPTSPHALPTTLTYSECVAHALRSSPRPLTVDELLVLVAAQRPLTKSARSAVYTAIRHRFLAVSVGNGRFGWLPNLLAGCTFRHTLTRKEMGRDALALDELLYLVFSPLAFDDPEPAPSRVTATLNLTGGEPVTATLARRERRWYLTMGGKLAQWVDQVGGQPGDDLIIQVLDGVQGRYDVRLQPREMRDMETIDLRNQHVGRLARKILLSDRRDRPGVPIWEIAAQLIARDSYRDPAPPGNLRLLLSEHSALAPIGDDAYTLATENPKDGSKKSAASSAVDWLFSSDLDSEQLDPLQLPTSLLDDELWDEPLAPEVYNRQNDGFVDGDADLDRYSDEPCDDYAAYLDIFEQVNHGEEPMGHTDYHLLEAELDMLIGLEYEFGYLHAEQIQRRQDLADRLFIDLDALLGDDDQWDLEDPPF